jgi:hypothetical protein
VAWRRSAAPRSSGAGCSRAGRRARSGVRGPAAVRNAPDPGALVLLSADRRLRAALDDRAAGARGAAERAPRAWHAPACLLLLATGLLVKLSFLPALALLPLWRVAAALAERRRPDLRRVVVDVLLFSLLPLALFLLVQWRLGLLQLYAVELRAIAGSDSHVAFVAMSLVHAAAVLRAAGLARPAPHRGHGSGDSSPGRRCTSRRSGCARASDGTGSPSRSCRRSPRSPRTGSRS